MDDETIAEEETTEAIEAAPEPVPEPVAEVAEVAAPVADAPTHQRGSGGDATSRIGNVPPRQAHYGRWQDQMGR